MRSGQANGQLAEVVAGPIHNMQFTEAEIEGGIHERTKYVEVGRLGGHRSWIGRRQPRRGADRVSDGTDSRNAIYRDARWRELVL